MTDFSLSPWEYRGSGASTAPHAKCRAQLGEREREFLLKMRGGVVYFKENKRAPLWAVTRVFERDLAGDELIEAWQSEVRRGNHGRYIVYRPALLTNRENWRESIDTAMPLIQRADHSGWMREWFEPVWHEIPPHRNGRELDVWGNQFQQATARAFYHVRDATLNRAIEPQQRANIETRWIKGSEAELQRIFSLALRLFVRADAAAAALLRERGWSYLASNPGQIAGTNRRLVADGADRDFQSRFATLARLESADERIGKAFRAFWLALGEGKFP